MTTEEQRLHDFILRVSERLYLAAECLARAAERRKKPMSEREKLEAIEDKLILRMIEMDERVGEAEYEAVREQLCVIQVALMGMMDPKAEVASE